MNAARLGVLMFAALGGCSTAPQASTQGAMAAATVHGETVAFDSIDGPPESIFRQFVQDLNQEAVARQMAMVPRGGQAQYRVRGYMAALVGKGRATSIAWVWDVYDAEQDRSVRIRGEEPASSSGRGTWAAADERVLRRIAKAGMDELAAFLAGPDRSPGRPPAAAPPPDAGQNVADTTAPAALASLGRAQ